MQIQDGSLGRPGPRSPGYVPIARQCPVDAAAQVSRPSTVNKKANYVSNVRLENNSWQHNNKSYTTSVCSEVEAVRLMIPILGVVLRHDPEVCLAYTTQQTCHYLPINTKQTCLQIPNQSNANGGTALWHKPSLLCYSMNRLASPNAAVGLLHLMGVAYSLELT